MGGQKAWRWPRLWLYARAWPLVETRLRLCLDVNTSNSDVLSKNGDDSPSVRTRAMGSCVINLGVIVTFASMWE